MPSPSDSTTPSTTPSSEMPEDAVMVLAEYAGMKLAYDAGLEAYFLTRPMERGGSVNEFFICRDLQGAVQRITELSRK